MTLLSTNYEKYKVGELMGLLEVVPNAYGYWEGQARAARAAFDPEVLLNMRAGPATYPVPNPTIESIRGGQAQRMYTPEQFMEVCQWYYEWKKGGEKGRTPEEMPTQGVGLEEGGVSGNPESEAEGVS